MSLHGSWQMIRAEFDGEAAPELVTQRTQLQLAHDRYEVRFEGRVVDRGTFEPSADLDDKTFLLHGKDGPNAGRTIPCIYQLVGDRLRVCFGLNGLAPTAFATTANQQRYLATYRRE